MDTKTHTSKLQKSSGLFMQLGLVLILFTVYLAFEYQTEEKVLADFEIKKNIEDPENYVFPDEVIIKRAIAKKIHKEPEPTITKLGDEIITTNNPKEVETVLPFDPVEENPSTDDPLAGYVDIPEPDMTETITFLKIEDAPIYKGCEKVKESERKACFEKKISKHISRKFNSNLANQLGLPSGKKRIFVEFLITKTGDIEITNASAPDIRLEKEAKRVVNLIPQMTPGKQRKKPVNVKYTLPIIFNVE